MLSNLVAVAHIAGKAHGVPVHRLPGGHVRDRDRMYGTTPAGYWHPGPHPAPRPGGHA
ncbi:hypothetical protein [Streptomyces sp. NPDC001508]|uniref:hypothetical protein n=1 Tax=Streptomyces sp. NPDC001508 TaxID=3154656 RepID=UPI00331C32B0